MILTNPNQRFSCASLHCSTSLLTNTSRGTMLDLHNLPPASIESGPTGPELRARGRPCRRRRALSRTLLLCFYFLHHSIFVFGKKRFSIATTMTGNDPPFLTANAALKGRMRNAVEVTCFSLYLCLGLCCVHSTYVKNEIQTIITLTTSP
jgi:hypothetical protein